jgi:excisionase family DNA binding protein
MNADHTRERILVVQHTRRRQDRTPRDLEPAAPQKECRPNILASEPPTLPRAADPPSYLPTPWLTYAEAAGYTGWSVGYLQNLVSAGKIPVYGRPRSRRFRRDMLDLYMTDPNMAMRKFRAERKRPHDRQTTR